jgi:hypothetical protein
MDISSVNAATSAYVVAGQSSKAAMPAQNSNITQPQQADSVSLSPDALKQSRLEQYPLKADPISQFQEWKNEGTDKIVLAKVGKPINELLPENQELIILLREKQNTLNSVEDRMLIAAKVSTVTQYGDKEIFNNESDIDLKDQAVSDTAKLQVSYLLNKNGELPKAEDVLGESLYKSGLMVLMDTGYRQTQSSTQPKASPEYMKNFDNQDFLENLLATIIGNK